MFQLEIIDACVNYIEALQDQLNIRNPHEQPHDSRNDVDQFPMPYSSTFLQMSNSNDVESNKTNTEQADEDEDAYPSYETSDEESTGDCENEEDKNNNNAALAEKEGSFEHRRNDIDDTTDGEMMNYTKEDNKSTTDDTNDKQMSTAMSENTTTDTLH